MDNEQWTIKSNIDLDKRNKDRQKLEQLFNIVKFSINIKKS